MCGKCLLASLCLAALSSGQVPLAQEQITQEFQELLGPKMPGLPEPYPWYDAKTDSMRPLDPPKQEQPRDMSWLRELFRWFSSISNVGFTALMWLLGAIVVGTLVYLILRSVAARREKLPSSQVVTADLVDRVEELPVRLAGIDDFLAAAAKCVRDGKLDEAIIYYYSHQLLTMDKAGVIRLARGKTNRRYLREVGSNLPTLEHLVGQTVAIFEDSFFGHLPIDAERFANLWNQRHRFAELAEAK